MQALLCVVVLFAASSGSQVGACAVSGKFQCFHMQPLTIIRSFAVPRASAAELCCDVCEQAWTQSEGCLSWIVEAIAGETDTMNCTLKDNPTPLIDKHRTGCTSGILARPGPPWPTFTTQAALQSSAWGTYYKAVYGEVPSKGYPINVADNYMLYASLVIKAKLSILECPASVGSCPTANPWDGQHYSYNNAYSMPFVSWIWHSYPYSAVAANTWTEVIHEADPFGDEHYGMWFVNAPGSGLYFNIGKTLSFPDHGNAESYFKVQGNEKICQAAAGAGLDSLQFLQHVDHVSYQCDTKNTGRAGLDYMNFEIVGVKLVGTYACGSATGAPAAAIKAGWQASKACPCDTTKQFLNCGIVGALQNSTTSMV